nr:MAG TPA: hypothetical protein [Caudoviricetes sp.]
MCIYVHRCFGLAVAKLMLHIKYIVTSIKQVRCVSMS